MTVNVYNAKLIRVISCLAVIFTHVGGTFSSNAIWNSFVGYGAEGVRCFFILSGYLMCLSKELEDGNVAGYYVKRAKRVLPVYYFVIAIYIFLGLTGGQWGGLQINFDRLNVAGAIVVVFGSLIVSGVIDKFFDKVMVYEK